jgi:hypothetical protein
MSAVKLTVHSTGSGSCSLSGKEGEGLTVSFEDGTISNAFLSTKAFMQLVRLKAGTIPKPAAQPVASPQPIANGPVAAPK